MKANPFSIAAVAAAAFGLSLSLGIAAEDNTTASLVANGTFEKASTSGQGPDGWSLPNEGGSWQQEDGNHFLRLSSTEPGKAVMLYRQVPIPNGVKGLEMTWRWRVNNLKTGKQAWFDARIMLDFKDEAGTKLQPSPPAPYLRKNTSGWISGTAKFLVPQGARFLEFIPALLQVESGTLDLDDVVIKPLDETGVATLAAEQAAAAKANETKQAVAAAAKRAKAAARVQPDGSLISNGGFEDHAHSADWPDDWGHPKEGGTWETEDGNHFLRLTSPRSGEMVMLYRPIDLPAGIKALELKWRQRVTNLKAGKEPWFDARLMLEFKDAAGKHLPSKPSPPYTQANTKGWVERSARFLVPEEAVTLELMPCLFQVERGTFDLDDFSLKPIEAGPLIAEAQAAAAVDQRAYVAPEQPNRAKWPHELHVDGTKVLDQDGHEVWLQGVNAGGLETLVQDKHILKSALVAVDDWKANIVRLPMKEEFWFGKSPLQKDGGKAYRDTIDNIVTLVANRGAYLLLDLHRFRAPTQEHLDFWKDAAAHFKDHPAVLFDLFNEPHDTSWEVWKNGGFVAEKKQGVDESAFLTEEEKIKNNAGFHSVGMQALVNAVRSTGAHNVIVASGLAWAGDLSGVANGYALEDKSGHGIIYGWHNYNWHKDWQGRVLGAAAKYPILVGEVGADVKKMDFIPSADQEDPYTWVPDMLGFIQKYKLNWTAWCLHPAATPVLISDWNYTPTPYWGVFAKEALAGKKFEMKRMR